MTSSIGHMTGSEQKVVTALQKFLMDTPADDLFLFLQKIGVRYSLSGNEPRKYIPDGGKFTCRIFVGPQEDCSEKMEYTGSSRMSMKGAVCDALAKFFVLESHDYHDYKGL